MNGPKGKGSNPNHARHGDVCVEILNGKPKDWDKLTPYEDKRSPRSNGSFVVASGETTGHAHVLDREFIMESRSFFDAMRREHIYAHVKKGATIKHEEHIPIEIEDDSWVHFAQQYEYDPEQLSRVAD
jgi:hypothetical protein